MSGFIEDVRYCPNCDRDTPQRCRDDDHERDASNDYRECRVCGWYYTGVSGEYRPREEPTGMTPEELQVPLDAIELGDLVSDLKCSPQHLNAVRRLAYERDKYKSALQEIEKHSVCCDARHVATKALNPQGSNDGGQTNSTPSAE